MAKSDLFRYLAISLLFFAKIYIFGSDHYTYVFTMQIMQPKSSPPV